MSAARSTRKSVSGPGATCRRSGLSGNDASSRAGRLSGSSVGVGACTTAVTPTGSRPAAPPSVTTGTAQRTDHDVRARSSAGRSASSAWSSSPPAPATRQALGTPLTVMVDQFAVVDRGEQPGGAPDGDLDVREGRQREQQRGPGLGEQPGDELNGGVIPQRQLDRRDEPVGQRGADGRERLDPRTAAAGPARGRTAPRARQPAPGRRAPAPVVRVRDQPTGPVADWMRGASLTATTAANPTPKRPTVPPPAASPRLLDARSVDSASTPAASSGAPVFSATSTPSRSVSRSRPGTPARTAASAAFCASSTTTRSRYPPSA